MEKAATGNLPPLRRKVFFLVPSSSAGGAEKVVMRILRYLDRNKFKPYLILFEGGDTSSPDLPDDVDIKILKYKSRRYGLPYLAFMRLALELAALLRKERPDALISFLWYPNLVAILSGFLSGISAKIIISERSTILSPFYEQGAIEFLRRSIIRFFYPRADMVIVNSRGIGSQLIRIFGYAPEKIIVIYNPVELGNAYENSKEEIYHRWFKEGVPIISSVGRLSREKGLSYLIEATHLLISEGTSCRLMICGNGTEEPELKKLVSDLGISGWVEFLGFQENPYKYLTHSALFVLPSLFEGLPNALLEAMALGVPSIATRCPTGPEEIITDEVNGLLVPPADKKALAEAIKRVLSDSELRRKLADGGKKRADDFSAEKIIKEYETAIEAACTAR